MCVPPSLPRCRQVDLQPHEVLYKVVVPLTRPHEYVKEFKQSPRREDDIAIVNAGGGVGQVFCFWVALEYSSVFCGCVLNCKRRHSE